jgi:hypothetical protein
VVGRSFFFFSRGSSLLSRAVDFLEIVCSHFHIAAFSFVLYTPATGTYLECLYALLAFGISKEAFPITDSHEIKLVRHVDFLRKRRALEDGLSSKSNGNGMTSVIGPENKNVRPMIPQETTSREQQQQQQREEEEQKQQQQQSHGTTNQQPQTIVNPNSLDVFLGRGRAFRYNPGNLRFHQIIELFGDRYEKLDRTGKKLLSKVVLGVIQESGARFLKQDETGWHEVDDKEARERVCHGFRNRRAPSKRVPFDNDNDNNNINNNSDSNNDLLLRKASILSATMSRNTSCFGPCGGGT